MNWEAALITALTTLAVCSLLAATCVVVYSIVRLAEKSAALAIAAGMLVFVFAAAMVGGLT